MKIASNVQRTLLAALIASAGLCGVAPAAHADVIVVTPSSPLKVPARGGNGIYLNLVSGKVTTTSSNAGWDVSLYNETGKTTPGYPGLFFLTPDSSTDSAGMIGFATSAFASAIGDVIGPAGGGPFGTYTSDNSFIDTLYMSGGGIQYVGLKFANETTGATNYGYLTLNTTAGSGVPASIMSYAYDNTGAAITVSVSAVPEPASLALMAFGLAGVGGMAGYKRRKTA